MWWITVSGRGCDSWLRQHPAEAAFSGVKQRRMMGGPRCGRIDSEPDAALGMADGELPFTYTAAR